MGAGAHILPDLGSGERKLIEYRAFLEYEVRDLRSSRSFFVSCPNDLSFRCRRSMKLSLAMGDVQLSNRAGSGNRRAAR
jgi:hypothetical protein